MGADDRDDRERDEEAQRGLIRQAIGRTDIDIELCTTGRWELAALIADRFRAGRVFLAGDAAHQLPPNRGGYGANTGIEDAHNVAWKLAAVLSGPSTPELLDTYDAERRPIAWLRHEQIFARADYKARLQGPVADVPIIDDDAMELGQLYRSTAVLGAGPELPRALRPDQWAGQPGTRAPHLSVLIDSAEGSTLDLFQHGWILVSHDRSWQDAASQAAAELGIEVTFTRLGTDVKIAEPPTPSRRPTVSTPTAPSLITAGRLYRLARRHRPARPHRGADGRTRTRVLHCGTTSPHVRRHGRPAMTEPTLTQRVQRPRTSKPSRDVFADTPEM